MRLHGLGGIHVNVLHEPARLVRANRKERQVDRSELTPDVAKDRRRIAAVSGEVDATVRPTSIVNPLHSARLRSNGPRAEKCCAGVSRDRSRAAVPRCHQSSSSTGGCPLDRNESARCRAASRPADRTRRPAGASVAQVAVIVVIVAEEHERDRRQITRTAPPARAPAWGRYRLNGPARRRVHRIGQDGFTARVWISQVEWPTKVSDRSGAGEAGGRRGATSTWARPRRPRLAEQPRQRRERLAVRAGGIEEARCHRSDRSCCKHSFIRSDAADDSRTGNDWQTEPAARSR